jgi:rSAM/selenodomain-associated transferase 1
MKDPVLIIFVRNPVERRVKTRLAGSIGSHRALLVYLELLKHIQEITRDLACDKYVFYDGEISTGDGWENGKYFKRQQHGNDLGEKMYFAFLDLFQAGYKSIVLIGSDCYQLTEELLEKAFLILESCEVVIGPALDGGYYLIGLGSALPELFLNREWSTATVFNETVKILHALNCPYKLLPVLSDVDEEADLDQELRTKAGLL